MDLDDEGFRGGRSIRALLGVDLLAFVVESVGHLDGAETFVFLATVLNEVAKLAHCLVVKRVVHDRHRLFFAAASDRPSRISVSVPLDSFLAAIALADVLVFVSTVVASMLAKYRGSGTHGL